MDKYELLEEVGHGGMATVYRARDPRLGREVAVKIIHKHLRDNPEVRRRFVSEARAVAKLRHPGIVDVYDVSEEDDDERYLVAELVRGKSLRQILDEHQALPPEVAASLGAVLCDAVEHAHQSSVIHRDIKPENVLVELPQPRKSLAAGGEPDTHPEAHRGASDSEPAGRSSAPPASGGRARKAASSSARSGPGHRVSIKLTDFGIAKVLDAQGLTSTGQILGSPAHMAPEQIEGGTVGPPTDVFALGVLLYECMVGHLPFEGKNPAQVLRRVLDGSFEPADSERPVVGGRWAAIIAGALQVALEQRTASAAELGSELLRELEALGIDDAAAELNGYFADPEAYRAELPRRLVPRLLERGERARRRGQVQGAAADFNRALAYRPDDLAILKRVSSLSARALWRQRARRLITITVGSIVVGGLAFGVARLTRVAPDRASPLAVATPSPSALLLVGAGGAAAVATTSAAASGSTAAARPSSVAGPRTGPPGTATLQVGPAVANRRVRFAVNPGGAKFALDGAETPWFGDKELSVGPHSIRAWMPAGNPCCQEARRSVVVVAPPEDALDQVQHVSVNLSINDARATLVNAPGGAIVSCSNGLTVGAGATGRITMREPQWSGSCTFTPGGQTRRVTLSAGRTTTIAWGGR